MVFALPVIATVLLVQALVLNALRAELAILLTCLPTSVLTFVNQDPFWTLYLIDALLVTQPVPTVLDHLQVNVILVLLQLNKIQFLPFNLVEILVVTKIAQSHTTEMSHQALANHASPIVKFVEDLPKLIVFLVVPAYYLTVQIVSQLAPQIKLFKVFQA